MTRLFLFVLLLFFVFISKGQTLSQPSPAEIENAPYWAQLLYCENPNYFQVEKEYQAYYRTHEFKKDNHVRYYRFWKKRFINYIDEKGFVNLEQEHKERAGYNAQTCYGNWTVVGPVQIYDANGNPSRYQANVYCIDQSKSDSTILFCGTESGEIYKSTNHGDTWVNMSLNLDYGGSYSNIGVRAIAIHPTNPDIIFFSSNQLIGKSINGGQTWTYVYNHGNSWWDFNAEKIVFHPQDANILYVATEKGLLTSINGGSNWTTVFNHPTYDICFKPSSPHTIYVLRKNTVTNVHEFLKSTDNGVSFQNITNGWYTSTDPNRQTTGGRIAVSEADTNRVYAYLIGESKYGDGGFIGLYKSIDGGDTWTLPSGPDGGPYTTSHQNLANALALGTGHHQGFYNCALLVSPTNADHILVGGGSIWKSVDGGASFTSLGGYTNGILDDAIHIASFHVDMQEFKQCGDATWVTTDGGIYRSYDFFSSTNFAKKDYGIHSTDIWGLGQGWNEDVLFAGAYHNGNISFYENWGQGNTLSLGGGEPATGYVNPGQNRLVYSSNINGRVIPLNIGDSIKETFFGIIPNESYWTLDAFSELEFDPRSYHVAYTGKDNQLWKTTNKAETFHLLHSFGSNPEDKITFIEISRKDADVMYVSQQNSTSYSSSLYKTTDGGLTWATVNLPLSSNLSRKIALQVDPLNPNNIWVGFNYSGNTCRVFNSNNGGTSWIEYTTPTIAGENLNTLTFIPGTNNGVYIGTNGTMYYKNDSMSDWVCFSDQLPPVTITFHAKPFYRDGKLRIATIKGIWESPLYQEPSRPFAKASVNKLTSYLSSCINDTLHFVDHSILNHENAIWEWTFGQNATPSTSNHWQERVVFNTVGTHDVFLKITDGNGFVDRDTLEIEIVNSSSIDYVFEEDFENETPDIRYRILNHQEDDISWYINDTIGGFGLSNQSMAINGFYSNEGGVDDLEYDINLEYLDSPMVTFDVAYAYYGGSYTDTLDVLISTDCGETFQSLYSKGGESLATVSDLQTAFYPLANQWRTDTVSLLDYTSVNQALLVFKGRQYYGQNLFLDNINLKGEELSNVSVPEPQESLIDIKLYPNPSIKNQPIFIQGPKESIYSIELFSSDGKQVFSKLRIEDGSFILLEVPPGSYAYRISTETIIKHGVLIIQ